LDRCKTACGCRAWHSDLELRSLPRPCNGPSFCASSLTFLSLTFSDTRIHQCRPGVAQLESFSVFTKGGFVLFSHQNATLSGDPVGALITTCLLEERAGDDAFSYTAPDGVAYALKWTFHNEAGLVFVAVYQRALALSYVDNLLANVKKVFTERYYQPQARGARSVTCILRSRCSHRRSCPVGAASRLR